VFLLCEQRFEQATHDLVKTLNGGDQLVVVTGDITQPDLGLGDAAERVRAEQPDFDPGGAGPGGPGAAAAQAP